MGTTLLETDWMRGPTRKGDTKLEGMLDRVWGMIDDVPDMVEG